MRNFFWMNVHVAGGIWHSSCRRSSMYSLQVSPDFTSRHVLETRSWLIVRSTLWCWGMSLSRCPGSLLRRAKNSGSRQRPPPSHVQNKQAACIDYRSVHKTQRSSDSSPGTPRFLPWRCLHSFIGPRSVDKNPQGSNSSPNAPRSSHRNVCVQGRPSSF